MNVKPKVLIVILNYGTYGMTVDLIQELRIDLAYDNYSIMVIDNHSPNESAKILEEKSNELGFIFYANDVNSGYSSGNNIGIRYAIEHGYDYSWILNNDVEIREKDVLQHMVEIAEKEERIGCMGPMIYTLDSTICAPYCRRPSFWSLTGGIVAERRFRQRFTYKSGEVYRVYGCCMLLRNKAMQDIDCLDERTFLYGEEDILAERLMARKYKTYYDADVSVTHKESSSVKEMSKRRKQFMMKEMSKSFQLYLKEYRRFSLPCRCLCDLTRKLIILLR